MGTWKGKAMSTTEREPTTVDVPFDPDALRARYEAERDKRVRPDGNEQYIEIAGRFGRYLDDPYSPHVDRAPLRD